jgi:hypothetical protein
MNNDGKTADLLFFSRDPGGANVLVALYETLTAGDEPPFGGGMADDLRSFFRIGADVPHIRAYAKDFAAAVWERQGYTVETWPADTNAETVLRRAGVGGIVTEASSIQDRTCGTIWRAARTLEIPCAAVLDHTTNITARFVADDDTPIFPDRIYVLDDASKRALIDAGYPADSVAVYPNIHLERAATLAGGVDGDTSDALRRAWHTEPGGTVVLFASECASEMVAAGHERYMDEFAVLAAIVERIRNQASFGPVPTDPATTVLVIRPHPRDTEGKYNRFEQAAEPRIVVSTDGTSLEAAKAADVVVGVKSMLLQEAATLGRPIEYLDGCIDAESPQSP